MPNHRLRAEIHRDSQLVEPVGGPVSIATERLGGGALAGEGLVGEGLVGSVATCDCATDAAKA